MGLVTLRTPSDQVREPNEMKFLLLAVKVKVTEYERFLCSASKVSTVGVTETVRKAGVATEMRL